MPVAVCAVTQSGQWSFLLAIIARFSWKAVYYTS